MKSWNSKTQGSHLCMNLIFFEYCTHSLNAGTLNIFLHRIIFLLFYLFNSSLDITFIITLSSHTTKFLRRGEVPFLFFSFFFLNKFIYLFIFGCVGSLLLCTGFLQLRRAGATLRCSVRASHFGGFSCLSMALGTWDSVVVARGLGSCGLQALELRLSSCDARAQQLWRKGLVASRHAGSSRTRDRTHVPCIGRRILNHCTTREVPHFYIKSLL